MCHVTCVRQLRCTCVIVALYLSLCFVGVCSEGAGNSSKELPNRFKSFRNSSLPPSLYQAIRIQYKVISGYDMFHRADVVWHTLGQSVPAGRLVILSEEFNGKPPFDFPLQQVMRFPDFISNGLKYRYSQLKWLHAILGTEPQLPYDWLVLLDDDTFLIHSALQQLLAAYSPTELLLVGKIGEPACHILCGGAGFALSRALVASLRSELAATALRRVFTDAIFPETSQSTLHFHSDVLLSHFIKDRRDLLGHTRLVPRSEFKNFPPVIAMRWFKEGLRDQAVSFHRIASPELYWELYLTYYSSNRSHTDMTRRRGRYLEHNRLHRH